MKFLQKSLAFFVGTEYDYRDGKMRRLLLKRGTGALTKRSDEIHRK